MEQEQQIAAPRTPNDVEDNKDVAALSYAWILSVVVFFAKPNSPFVRFHAKQAMVLFVMSLVFWLIPIVGKLLELIVLALCVLGFLNAAQGLRKELPFVGQIARGEWSGMRQAWKDFVHSVAGLMHRQKKSSGTDAHASAQSVPDQNPPTV